MTYENVLVLGGGSGIGLGIAEAFAKAGHSVAIAGRTQSKLDDAIAGTSMKAKACDAGDRAQLAALIDWFESEIGPLHILVFSAGVNVPKRTFADIDPADFDKVIGVNLTGAFNAIHAVLPKMRERGDGLIFNVTSLAGIQTIQLAGLPYSASKTAQDCLGKFVNLEALPDGVRLTNVAIGETNTPLLDDRPEPPPPEKRARMVHPEDIAEMVLAVTRLPKRAVVPELIVTPAHMPRL